MAEFEVVASNSRVIRVFLSSTFRDFMEERDLLVKQVFPELRRKARERGVEVVDVDLRWGITEEESRQGKVIPICLGEIDRCRPYFVGMLGERYGWIPPASQYSPEVIERQPWLKVHQGGVSVTELEILHGVLRNPEMAGRAFFYFRAPAWSTNQSEPGFVCETAEEEEKLADLKQRIRSSGFPVVDNLAPPQVMVELIKADLWKLVEQQYPDLDQPDALEREERQHVSFRHSRLGVYLGGEDYIKDLETLISAGQQKVLITGESGAGKSALIANWIEVHHQNHPDDVVFAHHLGCSNDASAIQPLLERLIQNASRLLLSEEQISEALPIPEDWWKLVALAAEALQSLGRWAQQNNHRWIWVLDGLDRLDPDDQKALPWLPLTIPEGVVIVASALECPAKEILLERNFKALTIRALQQEEQDELIQRYLGRYTKQLVGELRNTILSHPLAGSPLFLRVLLEELRQCGRYESLAEQLTGYLSAETIDDLYERVLERLEADGNGENVRKVMTALWASRAGLSEEELLAITGLVPFQWAPIDLALEQAFGRNGNRLIFDHDYLRIAVNDRYLISDESKRLAHSDLADYFGAKEEWDDRKAEEWPWQLQQAGRTRDLRALILDANNLYELVKEQDNREVVGYWRYSRGDSDRELDELIAASLDIEIEKRRADTDDLISFVDALADLFDEAGLYRETLLKLRTLSLELEEASETRSEKSMLRSLQWLADTHRDFGNFDEALLLYQRCLNARERLLGTDHALTLTTINQLGGLYRRRGDYDQSEACFTRCLETRERLLGPDHPKTLISVNNLGLLYSDKGDDEIAEKYYLRALKTKENLLGPDHPSTLTTISNLAGLYRRRGDYEQAEAYYTRCLETRERLLGPDHPKTNITRYDLAGLLSDQDRYQESIPLRRLELDVASRRDGANAPGTLTSLNDLAIDLRNVGELEESEAMLRELLASSKRVLDPDDFDIGRALGSLTKTLEVAGKLEESIEFAQQALKHRFENEGPDAWWTNRERLDLSRILQKLGRSQEVIQLLQELQASMVRINDPDNEDRQLISDAAELLRLIEGDQPEQP